MRGFTVTVNLDELIRIVVPLIFLILKLAFLLWIFGKHASRSKRILLTCLSVAYVVYEAWSMRSRRAAEARRAREREREEVLRAQRRRRGDVTPGIGGAPPDFPGGANAPPLPEADGRQRQPRRPPPTVFTPRYWVNAIAGVGLAAEAREMGLIRDPNHVGSLSRRLPPDPPPRTLQGRARRAFRRTLVGFVLFIGTLVPDVEKRRRRLLEKRERVRAQVAESERNARIAAYGATLPSVRPPHDPADDIPADAHLRVRIGGRPWDPRTGRFTDTGESLYDETPTTTGATEEGPEATAVTSTVPSPSPPPLAQPQPQLAATLAPPRAEDAPLLAPPTPDLGSDDEEERPEGDVDEVGMCVVGSSLFRHFADLAAGCCSELEACDARECRVTL
jgi:hypothetical protein